MKKGDINYILLSIHNGMAIDVIEKDNDLKDKNGIYLLSHKG